MITHKHCLLMEDMVFQNIKAQALQYLIQGDQSDSSSSKIQTLDLEIMIQ